MAITSEQSDRRTDFELVCPIPGCARNFDSVPGLMAHVGHHADGWDRAEKTPRQIKREATADDPQASRQVARVEHYLERHDVPEDAIVVYYDHSYGKVQIEKVGPLDSNGWDALQRATRPEGIQYVGTERSYCTEEFVDELPEPPADGECSYPSCGRDGPLVVPAIDGGESVTLCPFHRKRLWGVTS